MGIKETMPGRASRSKSSKGVGLLEHINVLLVIAVAGVALYALSSPRHAPSSGPDLHPSIDGNNDGQIDAHELLAAAADKNGDGHVDHTELQDLADKAKSGATIPTPSVDNDELEELDADGDGDFDMDDMKHHMWRNIGIGAAGASVVLYLYFNSKLEEAA